LRVEYLGPGTHAQPSSSDVALDPYAKRLAGLDPAERLLLHQALWARGRPLHDRAGELVGKIAAVLIDRETARPQWLAVERSGGGRLLVGVPIAGLKTDQAECRTPLPAAAVRSAPSIGPGGLTAGLELELCQHYRITLTRGAACPAGERRATSSRAFQDGERVGWLPGPRGG
jgi:hypothetical protein